MRWKALACRKCRIKFGDTFFVYYAITSTESLNMLTVGQSNDLFASRTSQPLMKYGQYFLTTQGDPLLAIAHVANGIITVCMVTIGNINFTDRAILLMMILRFVDATRACGRRFALDPW